MERILVTLPVEDRHRAAFESAAPLAEILYMAADSVTEDILGTVTAVIGNVSAARFKNFANIRWVQLNLAGTDGFTSPGVLAPGTVLTNASGAYGLAVSEHMLGQLLMQIKRLDQYQDAQRKRQWTDFGTVKSIWGSRTLVVGLGDIGGAFARKMYALGSEVQGIRKSPGEKPEELEAVGPFAQLDEWLPEADFVALSLPGTPATYHLFGAERLARMKPGAVLINAGRGQTVDSLALNDALRNGRLGGACLDVTDPEPLPADHPLWDAPNLLLTPHVSGFYHLPETLERIVRIAVSNLKAFMAGQPLKNQVDFACGYRRNVEDNQAEKNALSQEDER